MDRVEEALDEVYYLELPGLCNKKKNKLSNLDDLGVLLAQQIRVLDVRQLQGRKLVLHESLQRCELRVPEVDILGDIVD